MLPKYEDILSRIKEEPLWWSEGGVPRYGRFTPAMVGIYAKEVALLEIQCAACEETFMVSLEWSKMDEILNRLPRLSSWICEREPGWGDPPRHDQYGSSCAGETMSSDVITVVEFWRENEEYKWVRVPECEGQPWARE